LKKSEFLIGKFTAFAIIGVIESIYILLLAVYAFNTAAVGNLFYVFVIEMLLVAPTLGLGLLLSTFIKTEKQAIAILPLITIPAILVSQTFSPIEVIPVAFRWLAYLSPMTYSNEALRAIMIKGSGLTEVLDQIYALVTLGVVSMTAGIIAFKKRLE
jgi:ABC-2 type transport system permease protein